MADGLDLVIVTNSPGELSSWVRVTVERLKTLAGSARIIVMLVPCPFASGREEIIARAFPEVDYVVAPGEFLRFLLGFPLRTYRPAPHGIVIFLGGDYWHALWAAKRLHYRSAAYAVRPSASVKRFDAVCVTSEQLRDDFIASGVLEERVHFVGDLMVEGVRPTLSLEEARKRWKIDGARPVLGFLPGSRLYHVYESVPVFLKVAEEIGARLPGTQFVMGLSPFITIDEFRDCLTAKRNVIPGVPGTLEEEEGILSVTTAAGVSVRVLHRLQYDVMNLSDLIITIPGTNTAEVAIMGKPMIVAAAALAKIPRGGIGGILGALPLGRGFHVWLMKSILRKLRFAALPNLIAGRHIVPEVFVERGAFEITDAAVPLLENPSRREAMVLELSRLMGTGGAALVFSQVILSLNGGGSAGHLNGEERSSLRGDSSGMEEQIAVRIDGKENSGERMGV
jgi:lipid-A-disaccharide synthase